MMPWRGHSRDLWEAKGPKYPRVPFLHIDAGAGACSASAVASLFPVAGGKMKPRTETRSCTVCPWLQLATATTRIVGLSRSMCGHG